MLTKIMITKMIITFNNGFLGGLIFDGSLSGPKVLPTSLGKPTVGQQSVSTFNLEYS